MPVDPTYELKRIAQSLSPKAIRIDDTSWKTSCPVVENHRHGDKNPSLSLSARNGKLVWHCHAGCGQTEVLDKLRAMDLLPRRDGDAPVRQHVSTTPKPQTYPKNRSQEVLEYLYQREISDATIEHFKIGSVDGGVVFPYFVDGELQHTKTKMFKRDDQPYVQSKGGGKCFFNLDSIDFGRPVVVCEGEIDCMSLHEAGHTNCISVPNGASLGDDPLRREYIASSLKMFDPTPMIVLAVDADDPGFVLREKLADVFGRDRCSYVEWPEGCKDASDVLVQHSTDHIDECVAKAVTYPVRGLQGAEEHRDAVFKLYREGRKRGLSTGYANVDTYYTIQAGELEIVTGHPGSGKSNWLDQLMVNTAKQYGIRHAVCSFETPPDQHLAVLAEKYNEKSFVGHGGVRLNEAELSEAVEWIEKHFTFIRLDDDVAPTVDVILRHARAAVMRFGIKCLVLDPWNYFARARKPNQTATEYVSEVLSKLRSFAQRNGVHVWLVAHPSKMLRDKDGSIPAPTGMDVLGSVHFFTKCDVLSVVHRHPTVAPSEVEIIFRKIRFRTTGNPGTVQVRYAMETGSYSEPSEEGIS